MAIKVRSRAAQASCEEAETLRVAGLNPTRIRIRILHAVRHTATVVTPEAVFHALNGICSRGSAYRTMAELHRAGLLSRYRLGDSHVAYALQDEHLRVVAICTRCGHSQVVDDDPGADQCMQQMMQRIGFQAAAGPLYVNGLCPNCQARRPRRRIPLR